MIKLQRPVVFDFRCGEVLCTGPTSYEIGCALCGKRFPYESFPQHFRREHLPEACAEMETEDCKLFEAPGEEQHLDAPVEPLTIKLEDDPIAHDEANACNDRLTVDLAQIALLDQEHETDRDVAARVQLQSEDTIASRRLRRTAALRNLLVQPEHQTSSWKRVLDEADGTSHCRRLSAATDGDEKAEAEAEAQADDARDMLFQCDLCDRAYNTKRSLQSHIRGKHREPKPAEPRKSKSPPAMDVAAEDAASHGCLRPKRSKKAPPKVYRCHEAECNQTFRTERDLRGHRWKHTGIFCDICGKPFTQSGNMMRHRQRHSGIKPYKCQAPECDATFYTQKELTSHNICHTGRMPCICEVCGRPCRDRGVLTAHMRRHTGERPAKCEVCGKAFYSFHDLNVHAVSHTSLRPFVCDVCGSTFQRKKALRVHKLLHSEQRKYSCKLCSKSFAQSGGLNAHMRTHESARAK
ncbi:hypothetical protein KR222_007686, partial [Zaprionus bogoriensis]